MSLPVSSTTPDQERSEAKTLSLELEPSPSLLLAMIQLLKAHNRQTQAVELCKMALNHFPQDMGLRLGLGLAYMELNEKEKGWTEIKNVALELKNLAPTIEMIAAYSRQFNEIHFSKWFTLVANILAKYPEGTPDFSDIPPRTETLQPKDLETPVAFPSPEEEISVSSSASNKEKPDNEEFVQSGSKVMSSLNDWLTQLKGGKAKEESP